MIQRSLARRARDLSRQFPTVTITGPRQSGKTTLARMAFPKLPYASLEAPDVREFATEDPRGFLAGYPHGAILDEVQRAPDLTSYLQGIVDEPGFEGSWILTGSQDFALLASLSQSLAGRTAVLHLLPPSLEELRRFEDPPQELLELLFTGAYPRIQQEGIEPRAFYEAYVATYLERDVRQVLNIGDVGSFQTFVRLCAGRTGSLVNFSSLGADAGVSQPTSRSWLSALEAGFLVFRLRPYLPNLRKRLIKTPKLYFYDSGLLCYLLGIRDPEQLRHHAMRGAVFESWVVSEVMKAHYHRGVSPSVFFFQDRRGLEVDLVVERGGHEITAAEIKSGATLAGDFLKPLDSLREALAEARGPAVEAALLYGGEQAATRRGVRVVPWAHLDRWVRTLF
jgi:predicted AAA+ superfamily ATPase